MNNQWNKGKVMLAIQQNKRGHWVENEGVQSTLFKMVQFSFKLGTYLKGKKKLNSLKSQNGNHFIVFRPETIRITQQYLQIFQSFTHSLFSHLPLITAKVFLSHFSFFSSRRKYSKNTLIYDWHLICFHSHIYNK